MNSTKKYANKYWSYDICQNLETLPDKALETFKPKGRFFDDAVSLFEILTISPHPSLNSQVGKDTIDPTSIVFDNILVDINSLRILFYLLPFTKILVLKFSKNSFDYSNLEYLINSLLTKQNNVFNLYFEWNSDIHYEGKQYKSPETIYENELINQTSENILDDFIPQNQPNIRSNINDAQVNEILLKSKLLIAKLGSHPRLDSLCLRGNFLGDNACISLIEALKSNQVLRNLNLYKNSLGSKTAVAINQLLEVNRKIEDLNIGGNLFNDDDFKVIIEQLGKYSLSDEEVDNYNKKLKEKNEILEKNKKLKASKKQELPVPNLPEVDVVGEHYYMFKNNKLKTLNLMHNNLTKNIFASIIKVIERTEEVLFIFDIKIFEKIERDKLADPKNKFTSKVYLAK